MACSLHPDLIRILRSLRPGQHVRVWVDGSQPGQATVTSREIFDLCLSPHVTGLRPSSEPTLCHCPNCVESS
jgi:hypothetical protein